MCHGAQLAIPGVLQISPYLEKGDLVGIYSQKGEIVALAESLLSENEIKEQTKGYAFQTKRIIMKPKNLSKKIGVLVQHKKNKKLFPRKVYFLQ